MTTPEQEIQAIIDKATNTANEIATRAVGRVIEERDRTAMLLNSARTEAADVASKLASGVKQLQQLQRKHEELKVEFRGFQDDIAYLRDQVRGLTSDAEKAGELIGKVVTLKSGAGDLLMTAAAVTEDGLIQCFWSDSVANSVYSRDIPLAALKIVPNRPATKRTAK